MIDFSKIKEWQSLAGSFIGAFLPISFALFVRHRDSRKDYLRGLSKLDKFLAYSINELYELRESVELFVARIEEHKNEMELQKGKEFILDSTNFPLQKIEYERSLFDIKIKSSYLTNKLMMCHLVLKNINDSLSEIREEFQMLKGRNFDMVFSGKINVINQNQLRIDQLISVENILKDVILKKNFPIAIQTLLGTKIILTKYLKFFGFFYRIYYEGLFKNVVRKNNGQNIIEDKFKKELDVEFNKIEELYNKRISNKI